MRLLLDTHIALWAIVDGPRLSKRARKLISAPANAVVVSAVSVWEIAIKHHLRKQNMPISAREALSCFRDAGYELLAITPAHCEALEALPDHHRDPFDRMLIAQARSEPLRLLTADATVARYGEGVVQI